MCEERIFEIRYSLSVLKKPTTKQPQQPLAASVWATMQSEPASVNPIGMPVSRPETFRLPKRGGDPFFGLSRAWYYAAEKNGLIKLGRLRDRGKLRGVTLVPYDDVAALIAEARKQ